ncbi:MAG: NUDIX domain-containing protein [Patescibacteria group bacterium]|jgi:8-oxo-dGTP pyrophosphatase MutT (NUDIX family)
MRQKGRPVIAKEPFTAKTITTDGGRIRKVFQTSDSANVLIYIADKDQILLVRQQREAMARVGNPKGWIIESVAGRFDRKESVRRLLAREASEEVGGTIRPKDIVLLNNGAPLALSAGCLVEKAWLGYIAITSDQLEKTDRQYGLKEEGESITRVFLPVSGLENFTCEDVRVFALLQWFLRKIIGKR